MADDHALLRALLEEQVAPGARLVAIRHREGGAQGYSGATLRYYEATYERADARDTVALATKPAGLVERRALAWLGARGLPVPRSHTADLATDAPRPTAMEDVGERPPPGDRARLAAPALAAIHRAALGRGDELPWLSRADPAFFAEAIVDRCWRKRWRHLLTGAGYTDWYGRWHPSRAGGDPFWAQFAGFDGPLEEAAARFAREMTALWAAGDALTLIHADFHLDHLLARDGRAAIVDWEQARYGPLYLDLPNYFARDEALPYRDALADLGHAIPADRFLAGYDAASRYVGFKYFGVGIAGWRPGDPPRRPEDALYWIALALHGASGGRPARQAGH